MTNLLVMPLALPILVAVALIFFRNQPVVQRLLTALVLVVLFVLEVWLLKRVHTEGIQRLDFGGWQPPFGILFVADSLSVLFVIVATFVSLCCVMYGFYSFTKEDEQMFVYPLMLFMLAGVNGSFLTGDLFNLFVCFEVMLLASYALIALGNRREQLRESLKYVLMNIVGSWLFLVAIAFLYGTLGTLNMAHIAERAQQVGEDPLITTIALIFIIVFALKGGLLLFFWLPGSYSVPSVPIAAMFAALLTKVGVYAIFRTATLLFPVQLQQVSSLFIVMAVITLLLGCLGALSYRDLRQIAAFNVVIGVGFVLLVLTTQNEVAYAGAIYYVMHDMIAKALLFLIFGTMIYVTRQTNYTDMSGLIRHYPLFGWLFFIMMLTLVGVPPLSGFVGKLLIGQGLIATGHYGLLAIGFASSVVVLYALLRVFLQSIFGETSIATEDKRQLSIFRVIPLVVLTIGVLCLGLGGEFIMPYVKDAAEVLANPFIYTDAILRQ